LVEELNFVKFYYSKKLRKQNFTRGVYLLNAFIEEVLRSYSTDDKGNEHTMQFEGLVD
jgi:hypothetical protein